MMVADFGFGVKDVGYECQHRHDGRDVVLSSERQTEVSSQSFFVLNSVCRKF